MTGSRCGAENKEACGKDRLFQKSVDSTKIWMANILGVSLERNRCLYLQLPNADCSMKPTSHLWGRERCSRGTNFFLELLAVTASLSKVEELCSGNLLAAIHRVE